MPKAVPKRLGFRSKSIPGRAMLGLWHGQGITYGYYATYSNKKVRRRWYPHVRTCQYHSDVLDKTFTIAVTTKAQRHIDKMGGFDRYILYTSDYAMNSLLGSTLREAMLKKLEECPDVEKPKKFIYPKLDRSKEIEESRKLAAKTYFKQRRAAHQEFTSLKRLEQVESRRILELAVKAAQNVEKKDLLKNQLPEEEEPEQEETEEENTLEESKVVQTKTSKVARDEVAEERTVDAEASDAPVGLVERIKGWVGLGRK